MHAGQGCATPTRMLLPRSRYAEGIAVLEGMYANIQPGDPQDAATLCGPVISDKQRTHITNLIQSGIDQGAKMLVGGVGAPEGLDKGFYVKPTLFVDVDNSMRIAQEEIFGPVLVVIPYDTDEDAIRIANDSSYGLSGMVSSGSLERSIKVARKIRTGSISMNGGVAFGPDVPFGGYKDSGIGRQNGAAGFDQYLEIKSVAWPAG
jgi:acyl-CoA reductase-like NAD-dependent aldehyde dehydrogenase